MTGFERLLGMKIESGRRSADSMRVINNSSLMSAPPNIQSCGYRSSSHHSGSRSGRYRIGLDY